MSDSLTHGNKAGNNDYYQPARAVACMAQTLAEAYRQPADVRLAFYLSESRRADSEFVREMNVSTIKDEVKRQIERWGRYEDISPRRKWFGTWFLPTVEHPDIAAHSWEEIIDFIRQQDPASGRRLADFYARCRDAHGLR